MLSFHDVSNTDDFSKENRFLQEISQKWHVPINTIRQNPNYKISPLLKSMSHAYCLVELMLGDTWS